MLLSRKQKSRLLRFLVNCIFISKFVQRLQVQNLVSIFQIPPEEPFSFVRLIIPRSSTIVCIPLILFHVNLTDDQTAAQSELVVCVVHHTAQRKGEWQRSQFLLQCRSHRPVRVHHALEHEIRLGQIDLVPKSRHGLLHSQTGLQLHAKL